MTTIKRIPDPPLNVNEAVIAHAASNYQSDPTLNSCYVAMKIARERAQKIESIAKTLVTDRSITLQFRNVRIKTLATQQLQSAAKALDDARSRCLVALDFIDRKTVPRKSDNPHLATEIRNRLKTGSDKERMALLSDADPAVIAAVAESPNPEILTGVGRAQRDMLIESWRNKRHPAEAAKMTAIRKCMTHLENAARNLAVYVSTLYDQQEISDYERNQHEQRSLME